MRHLIAVCLTFSTLAYTGAVPVCAQEAAAPARLTIVVVEGEGAINNVKQRSARPVIVEVRDENNKPVAGAAVVAVLPGNGPSGAFVNGAKSVMLTTDSKGQAALRGFRPNAVEGPVKIQVNASYRGASGATTVTQTNAAATAGSAAGSAAGHVLTRVLIGLAVAAVAGTTAARVADRGPAKPPTPPPTVITPGTPTVK